MTDHNSLVYVIDDDSSVGDAISNLLEAVGYQTQVFNSSEEFLQVPRADIPSCLILDVKLPGMNGLEFQQHLENKGIRIPIIFITAHGDIPMTARAMKQGAIEFLAKPFQKADLIAAIQQGLETDRKNREDASKFQDLQSRFETLTLRQREVMEMVVAGQLNKQIAAKLDLSEVTVKMHRRQVMERMNADSLADLVRMWDALNNARC